MSDVLSPQFEALNILEEVIDDLTNTSFDLKTNLRRCQHVCNLLGWQSKKDWFTREINGYIQDDSLPSYRKIDGIQRWNPDGFTYDGIKWKSEELAYGVDQSIYEVTSDLIEVRSGIDWLIKSAKCGYTETLENTKEVTMPSGKKKILLKRVRIFSSENFSLAVSQIERHLFEFASNSYTQLKFGDTIGDIWAKYRRDVDAALAILDLTGHLRSIEGGLLSDNPEDWRTTVLECRNLLNDLANILWQDKRNRYKYLEGNTDEGFMDVSHGKFGNRIAAYIHQKGVTGTRGKFIRNEAECLANSIQSLIAFQAEAHEPITFKDAQSISISTYILIGELARRTDMKPIDEYKNLAATK